MVKALQFALLSVGLEKVKMKRIQSVQNRLTICVVTSLLFMTGPAFAQNRLSSGGQTRGLSRPGQLGGASSVRGAGVGADKGEKVDTVEIKRMPPPNKTAMVRTPEFNCSVQNTMPKVTKKPREWALFEVKYETGSRWTDELAFNYYVMTKGRMEDGKDLFSFYTATVRYVDIPKGEHMSCVAIPPSLVERYGEAVAVALEVVGKDGKVLDGKSETIIPFPTKEWWKDSKVLDNPNVARRTGLVDRSKTPFALINADDYEVVQ